MAGQVRETDQALSVRGHGSLGTRTSLLTRSPRNYASESCCEENTKAPRDTELGRGRSEKGSLRMSTQRKLEALCHMWGFLLGWRTEWLKPGHGGRGWVWKHRESRAP